MTHLIAKLVAALAEFISAMAITSFMVATVLRAERLNDWQVALIIVGAVSGSVWAVSALVALVTREA